MSGFTPHDICAWAGRQTVGGAKRKAVLNALALFADRVTWECWPSYRLISQYTEIAERTVSRAMSELVRDGFVSRERIRRRDGSLGGWRFKLNPAGVEIVVPGAAMSGSEAEAAAEDDAGLADLPVANLAGGDRDEGERDGNEAQDVDLNQSPTGPGGETTTVVKLAPPPANGGDSIRTTTGTTTSPLSPNDAPASPSAPPDGRTADATDRHHRSFGITDLPEQAMRFRQALLQAYGAPRVEAWFSDVVVEKVDATNEAIVVNLATGSQVKADRIRQQFALGLADLWRRVNGPDDDRITRIRVSVSAELAAAHIAAVAAKSDEKDARPPPRRRRA